MTSPTKFHEKRNHSMHNALTKKDLYLKEEIYMTTNINVRNTKGATLSNKSAKKEMWILLILCQMTCLQQPSQMSLLSKMEKREEEWRQSNGNGLMTVCKNYIIVTNAKLYFIKEREEVGHGGIVHSIEVRIDWTQTYQV